MAIRIFVSDFSRRREASRPTTETFAFSSLDGRREILSRRRAIIESFAPNGSYDPASVRRASSGKRRRWSAGFGSVRRIRSVRRMICSRFKADTRERRRCFLSKSRLRSPVYRKSRFTAERYSCEMAKIAGNSTHLCVTSIRFNQSS